MKGLASAKRRMVAFPDHKHRIGQTLAGDYEGRGCVSTVDDFRFCADSTLHRWPTE